MTTPEDDIPPRDFWPGLNGWFFVAHPYGPDFSHSPRAHYFLNSAPLCSVTVLENSYISQRIRPTLTSSRHYLCHKCLLATATSQLPSLPIS